MTEPINQEPIIEDTSTSEPKEKTYSEKEWRGLLSDKQRETQVRQQLEAELQGKESEIALLKSEVEKINLRISQQEEDKSFGDPDDVATIKQLRKIRDELLNEVSKVEKKLTGTISDREAQRIFEAKEKEDAKSINKAMDKYTEEKYGKGLSFQDVLEGTRRMIERNPAYRTLISNDTDPGEMMYKIGMEDPTIAKRVEAYRKKLPNTGITSKEGLEGTTVPAGYFSQAYVKKMAEQNPGWVRENLQAIKESQKQWSKDDINQ